MLTVYTYTCMVLSIAIVVFLFHNFGRKKLFLGDGGSLFIGFILVCFGLKLINNGPIQHSVDGLSQVAIILSIFILPVVDSIRVYWGRIKSGRSPFRADKSHMHHLVISLKLSHKSASIAIIVSALVCMLLITYGLMIMNMTSIVLFIVLALTIISQILLALNRLDEWKTKISNLEHRD